MPMHSAPFGSSRRAQAALQRFLAVAELASDVFVNINAFVELDEFAAKLQGIIEKLLNRNAGYASAAQLYEHARMELSMLLNDNAPDDARSENGFFSMPRWRRMDRARQALSRLFADMGDHVVLRGARRIWFEQLPALPGNRYGGQWSQKRESPGGSLGSVKGSFASSIQRNMTCRGSASRRFSVKFSKQRGRT